MTDFDEAREADRLWLNLTEKQKAFLDAYHEYEDEDKAVAIADISKSSLYRWRKQDVFMKSYNRIRKNLPVKVSEEKTSDLLASEDEVRELAKEELVAMGKQIPALLFELLNIAFHGSRDSDRLRAIEDAMQYLGLDKGLLSKDEGTMTLIQKKILKWTNPRSFPSSGGEEAVEGEFSTLEDWAKEGE